MIPKRIHYCWFGRNPFNNDIIKCMETWKKYCPDYEIVRWSEDNYDISHAPVYVQQAYESEKWAFVTDYVRLDVVHKNGGIYLDTDVELISNLDKLLDNHAYFGFEDGEHVNTGLGFGAEKNSTILEKIMEQYQNITFINMDGEFDLTPCPKRNTEVFIKEGLITNNHVQRLNDGTVIFSSDYMNPFDYYMRDLKLTENSISIHRYHASWQSEEERKKYFKNVKTRRRYRNKENIRIMIKKILGLD